MSSTTIRNSGRQLVRLFRRADTSSYSLRRTGVTLMEVLFSIGIIMVGLLGVAVLVPAAGKMAADAQTLDRASRVGMNAVSEIEIRGLAQSSRWVHRYTDGVDNDSSGATDELTEGMQVWERGFCLDPYFVGTNNFPAVGATPVNNSAYFPYPAPDPTNYPAYTLRMRRVTLGEFANTATISPNPSAPAPTAPFSDNAADVFVSHDDLVFDRPSDPLLPAQQFYGQLGHKREYEGKLSWFATFAPHANDASLYTVSIVVQKSRSLSLDGVSERVAYIPLSTFYGGGTSGGDVAITHLPTGSDADLDVRRNGWVMLARTGAGGPFFRWYRIAEVDGELENNAMLGQNVRHVTLSGADWQPDVSNVTLVYVLPDVVMVYERTMRIERQSIWVP